MTYTVTHPLLMVNGPVAYIICKRSELFPLPLLHPFAGEISRIKSTIHSTWQSLIQPFSQDYGLASHTTHVMLCVLIVYMSGGDLQFNVDFERQIFEKLFHGRFIYLRVFARNLHFISFLITDL